MEKILFKKEGSVMGRRQILDEEATKFSVNVYGDNKRILDELTQKYNEKYSTMINKIISTLCNPPKEIQADLEAVILKARERAQIEYENTEDPFFVDDLQKKIQYYEDYLRLSGGNYKFDNNVSVKPLIEFKKVELADGCLQIPTDWIIVNPEEVGRKHNAAVLECRNHARYEVPHFVYLTDYKHESEYTDVMEEDFFRRCTMKWTRFPEIKQLSDQNQLIEDPKHPGEYLNAEDYFNAPIVCVCPISDKATKSHPYGAMIVRFK